MSFKRIAVLMGGRSAEREVSLSSGRGVMKALAEEGFDPVMVDPGDNVGNQLFEAKPDAAFNALHGRFGEDGTVQGLLELMRIPYTHSGVLASALAMHKERTKDVYRAAGLPVVKSIVADRRAVAAGHLMAPPYVIKPVNEGSSVGVYIIRKGDNRPPAELGSDTWNLSNEMMVEEFVPGRELTVSVMGEKPLGVTEITTELEFYDYEAKYAAGGSRHILPADLPAKVSEESMALAVAAHRALGCRGVTRTDFRYDDTAGKPRLILLETNTQPGMTPTSLVPEQAAHIGDLLRKIVPLDGGGRVMRSLKIARKPRGNPRAKTVRPATRGPREAASVQPGSARRSRPPGLIGRALRRIGAFFARPMLLLTAGLTLLALIAALLVSGVVGRTVHGVKNGVSGVVSNAGFGVYEMQITGNRRVPTDTIFAALGLKAGQSIFFIDLPAARARIMALDWIASVDVVRRYPDAIFVTVVEKRPFALWQTPPDSKGDAKLAVVERSGGVITTQGVEKFSKLPKLIGDGAPEAAADLVEAVMSHRAVSARTAAYERVSKRRWNLLLNDGVVVKLPETGWPKELDTLEHLIVDNGILERDVTEIDLRSPTQYFFVLKSGEKKDVERGKET